MDFSTTLTTHLGAIRNRDLEAFAATVDADCTIITLDGTVLDGRAAVLELHREWFVDPDWSIEFFPVKTQHRDGFKVALVTVDYKDVDRHGAPVNIIYLLSLTFSLTDEGWLLVHDQNTSRPND